MTHRQAPCHPRDRARRALLLTTLALGVALAAPLRADVLVVEQDGPAGTFSLVSSAVTAAAPGDLIVVRPGLYLDVVEIDGKPLTIVGEGGPLLKSFGIFGVSVLFEVRNLAANEAVVIQGLVMDAAAEDPANLVTVRDCAGPVVFEECQFEASFDGSGISTGLEVYDSDSVTLTRCTLDGGFGLFGQDALIVRDSRVFLYESTFTGSKGQPGGQIGQNLFPPGSAGRGAFLVGDAEVYAQSCTFQGGNGGGASGFCFAGEDGGAGLRMVAGPQAGFPVLRHRDCLFLGGSGGSGGCAEPSGTDGPDLQVLAGAATAVTGPARAFTATSPTVEGGTLTLFFNGVPGDQAALLLGGGLVPGANLGLNGKVLHLGAPWFVVPLGPVPGSGNLVVPVPIGELGAGIEFAAVPCQGLFQDAGGVLRFSGPSVPVFLDG